MGLLFGPFDFGFFLYKARRRAWKSKSNFEFLQPAGCKNSKIRFWSFFIGVYIYILIICIYASMHLCIYVSVHLCIDASMHLCIYASMHLCMYASMHLCIYASTHLCIYASIHLCIYASMHQSIYLSICRMNQARAKRGRRF
jgi:hypothetical protein